MRIPFFSPQLSGNSKLLRFNYRDGGCLLACRTTFWSSPYLSSLFTSQTLIFKCFIVSYKLLQNFVKETERLLKVKVEGTKSSL